MTSKERVCAAIAHEQPDRVPIDAYLRHEIIEELATHFGHNEVLSALGVDFRTVAPRYIGPERPIPEGCSYVDLWGVGYQSVSTGAVANFENVHQPWKDFDSLDDVEEYIWPEADYFDYSTIEAQCDAVSEYAVVCGDWGTPDISNGVSFGRGMERVMIDILTQDPVGVAIIDKRCDILFERWHRTLEAANGKIDILLLGEDTGSMSGPLYPPDIFDSFFRPRIQRFIDLGHAFGCKTMMHNCGNNRLLIPKYIEMGLDVVQSQPEPSGMEPETLKADFGDQITFLGLLSVQKTLPNATPEACRAEAKHLIEVMGKGGGYIFAPANLVQPDTPIRNILAAYETAMKLHEDTL